MNTKLQDTGERMIPELHKGQNIYGAHLGRYQAGLELVKNKTVLDIACGSGYGSKLMAKHAKHVYGVDVDKKTIQYAIENYSAPNITFKVGDGINIPLPDNSVEVVVSYETIEHVDDFKFFLNEIKRVLKKGGLFLLSTPNDKEYIQDNHFHLHQFSYSQLSKLLEKFFKYQKPYFQTLWLYSSILPANLQKKEWVKPITTMNTLPLNEDQCVYFFFICSDQPIKEEIVSLGVIGEHYKLRNVQTENKKNRYKHEQLMVARNENAALNKKLNQVYSSRSWKFVLKLRKIYRIFKRK